MSRTEQAFLAILVLGFVLLAGAFAWPRLFDPRSHWQPEQAEERTNLGMRLHEAGDELSRAQTEQERQAAMDAGLAIKADCDRNDAALRDAQERNRRPVAWLRWSGTACLLLGALGVVAARRQR